MPRPGRRRRFGGQALPPPGSGGSAGPRHAPVPFQPRRGAAGGRRATHGAGSPHRPGPRRPGCRAAGLSGGPPLSRQGRRSKSANGPAGPGRQPERKRPGSVTPSRMCHAGGEGSLPGWVRPIVPDGSGSAKPWGVKAGRRRPAGRRRMRPPSLPRLPARLPSGLRLAGGAALRAFAVPARPAFGRHRHLQTQTWSPSPPPPPSQSAIQ